MNNVIVILLVVVGLINFLPVMGAISAANISRAYSINLASNDLIILMRHRALLFGIVGGFVFYSIFEPRYQGAALIMAAVSMLGYLVIMRSVGGYNESIRKVGLVDVVGIIALVLVVIVKYFL